MIKDGDRFDLPFIRSHELDPFKDSLILTFVRMISSWARFALALLGHLGEQRYFGLLVELAIIQPSVVGPFDDF